MPFSRIFGFHRVTRRRVFLLQCLALFTLLATRADPTPKGINSEVRPFENGDRVCFLGDSITKGGSYHQLLEIFYAVRLPDRTIDFFNCGVGGDRASAILSARSFRLETDVLGLKPTVVVVMLGMNDVERNLYRPQAENESTQAARKAALETYRTSLADLVQTLQKAGPRVMVLSPTVYEESTAFREPEPLPGCNAALALCAGIARVVARDSGAEFVDVHAAMDAANRGRQTVDPTFSITGAGQSWNDRVHPGSVGHYVIAHSVLTAQGLLGAPVSLPPPGCRVPGYPDLPKALLDLGDQRRRIAEMLREPATLRYAMAKEQLDPAVPENFIQWLNQKQAGVQAMGKDAPWISKVLDILPREPELRAETQNLSSKIRKAAITR
jgi:lysophospholipase L1-like esterase